jgi:hypothetical protein
MRQRLAFSVLLACLVTVAACGGDNNPVAPSSGTSTQSPPAPAPTQAQPAQIAGSWTGTIEMEFEGRKTFGTIAMTLEQQGRSVTGSWRYGAPWDFNGTISGSLAVDGGTTHFTGPAELVGETSSGTGRCRGTITMTGPVTNSTIRMEGDEIQDTNCGGAPRSFVWILHR